MTHPIENVHNLDYPLGNALGLICREWVACQLAAYVKTGLSPNSYMNRPSSRLAQVPGDARQLVAQLWLDQAGPKREVEACAWLELTLDLSARTAQKLQRQIEQTPISPRIIGHCRRIVADVREHITPDYVRAAIESGWTGGEMRGVRPVRMIHHLLRLVRKWLPEGVQAPERPAGREVW